jgi:hypothetical protein
MQSPGFHPQRQKPKNKVLKETLRNTQRKKEGGREGRNEQRFIPNESKSPGKTEASTLA